MDLSVVLSSFKRGVLLRPAVYSIVSDAPTPSRRGFGILFVLLITIALTKLMGALLDVATLPRVELIQDAIYQTIIGLDIYQGYVSNNPNFANAFATLYNLFWTFLRWFGGYPSVGGTVFTAVSFVISTIFAWFTYGFIGFYVTKALGAEVEKVGDYLGLMGLAFAPYLLYLFEIVPGLMIPLPLITLWFLATVYQANRVTYNLSWWRAVLVAVLPFPINSILLTLVLHLGIYIGVVVSQWIMS